MKVWVTVYALTTGIMERVIDPVGGGVAKDMEAPVPTYYHIQGRDWHRTREGAVARAEQMRLKKIASLRKQIAKLEALRFKEESDG